MNNTKWKIIVVVNSSFIEEGYRLYNITLRPIGAEQVGLTAGNS